MKGRSSTTPDTAVLVNVTGPCFLRDPSYVARWVRGPRSDLKLYCTDAREMVCGRRNPKASAPTASWPKTCKTPFCHRQACASPAVHWAQALQQIRIKYMRLATTVS